VGAGVDADVPRDVPNVSQVVARDVLNVGQVVARDADLIENKHFYSGKNK